MKYRSAKNHHVNSPPPVKKSSIAEVSTLAIFVGAIGGAAAFGVLGLVIGPVLLSFAVALLRFAEENLPT